MASTLFVFTFFMVTFSAVIFFMTPALRTNYVMNFIISASLGVYFVIGNLHFGWFS